MQYQYQVQRIFDFRPNFNLLETPVFISDVLKNQLVSAVESIIHQLKQPGFRMSAHQAIPNNWLVPNEDSNPLFLQFDFAVTTDKYNQPKPKLIELQGFPALFFFQHAAWWSFQSAYEIDRVTPYFGKMDTTTYINILRKTIIGNQDPKETILLEVNPWSQRTAIDFAGAKSLLDIPVCNVRDLELIGNKLYYRDSKNKKIQVRRIFNRVILDDLFALTHSDLPFNLLQEVDVEWAGHPNWFLKYSKFALPFIQGDFSPKAFFLEDWDMGQDLKNYVLKPIHSFSGNGVILNPTIDDILKTPKTKQFILQEKVKYAPILESPNGDFSQLEIRVTLVQDPVDESAYTFMTTLVRAGKNNRINTGMEQPQVWTGGGIGLFRG